MAKGGAAPVRETEGTEASSGQVGPSKRVLQVIGGKMTFETNGICSFISLIRYHWYLCSVCVCVH